MVAQSGLVCCGDCNCPLDCDELVESPIFIKSSGFTWSSSSSSPSSSSSSFSRREDRVEAQRDRLTKNASDATDKFALDMNECKTATLQTINQRIGNVVEAFAQMPVCEYFFAQNRNNVVFSSVTISLREKNKVTRFMALGELDFLVIRPVKPVDLVSVKFDIYKVNAKTDRTFLGILLSLSDGPPLGKLRDAVGGKRKFSENTIVEIVGTNVLTGQDFIWSPAVFRHTTCVLDEQKVDVYGIAPKLTIGKSKKLPKVIPLSMTKNELIDEGIAPKLTLENSKKVIPLGLTKNELIDEVLKKVKNDTVKALLENQKEQ